MAADEPGTPPTHVTEILGYFLRNPQAVDSLEGIVRWRLLQESIHRNVEEISEALAWLVRRRLLTEDSLAASQTIYRLNPDKCAEAELLVKHARREE